MLKSIISATIGLGLLLSGCAADQDSLIFLHAPAWPADGGCGVDANTDTYLPRGLLDLAFTTPYDMPGILFNNINPQESKNTASGTDPSELKLKDADVSLSMPQDPGLLDAVSARDGALTDFTVTMPSNSIESGERHAVLVRVIPQQTTEALREEFSARHPDDAEIEIVASLVFTANRNGAKGSLGEVESREFVFPIDLCMNCLTSCFTCMDGQCPTEVSDWVGGVCGNAQDFPLEPSICAAGP